MIIYKSVDIENQVRLALGEYVKAYCRPLPAQYETPNILIAQMGGSRNDNVDTFLVMLYSRAESEAAALDTLHTAVAVLEGAAKEQTTAIRNVSINSIGSRGEDPVRPDLSLCSATLMIAAHPIKMEV